MSWSGVSVTSGFAFSTVIVIVFVTFPFPSLIVTVVVPASFGVTINFPSSTFTSATSVFGAVTIVISPVFSPIVPHSALYSEMPSSLFGISLPSLS